MSQYPPPYSPQQPAYGGSPQPPFAPQSPNELLAPARRAGVMMIVLGALAVVCGLCLASTAAMVNNPEMAQSPQYEQLQQQFQQIEAQLHISLQQFLIYMGVIPLAIGAVLGGIGFVVRGGGRGAVIAAMVLVSLLLAGLGLVILLGLIQGLAGGQAAQAILGVCFYAVPFGLLLLDMVWLVQAVRAVPKIEWARQHYQSQLWQYQQYQQAYLQNAQQPAQQRPPGGQPQGPPAQPPASPPSGLGYHYPAPPAATPPVKPAPPPPEPPSEKIDPPDGGTASP